MKLSQQLTFSILSNNSINYITMYFNNCTTLDQAKTLFRKLCKELHPDKGGIAKDFISMFNEFKAFKPSEGKEENFNADKFYNLIQKFDGLKDIQINFVGSFIWLEDLVIGATYEQKNSIKAISIDGYNNARFAGQKKLWYFSPSDYKQKAKSRKSFEEIKNTFGCNSYKTKKQLQLS